VSAGIIVWIHEIQSMSVMATLSTAIRATRPFLDRPVKGDNPYLLSPARSGSGKLERTATKLGSGGD
jgi:hypothetical protein